MRFAEATRRLAASAGLLSATASFAFAGAPKTEIVGVWRGESICVKGPEFPACRDESVEYDVSDAAGGAVHLAAYKVVDGEKVPMGEMDFTYDEKPGSWASEFQTARYHGLWTFTVSGDALTGTLVDLPSRHKVRDVSVRREPAPAK